MVQEANVGVAKSVRRQLSQAIQVYCLRIHLWSKPMDSKNRTANSKFLWSSEAASAWSSVPTPEVQDSVITSILFWNLNSTQNNYTGSPWWWCTRRSSKLIRENKLNFSSSSLSLCKPFDSAALWKERTTRGKDEKAGRRDEIGKSIAKAIDTLLGVTLVIADWGSKREQNQ